MAICWLTSPKIPHTSFQVSNNNRNYLKKVEPTDFTIPNFGFSLSLLYFFFLFLSLDLTIPTDLFFFFLPLLSFSFPFPFSLARVRCQSLLFLFIFFTSFFSSFSIARYLLLLLPSSFFYLFIILNILVDGFLFLGLPLFSFF